MSAITVSVGMNELDDWECLLKGPGGSVAVYTGASSKAAREAYDTIDKAIKAETEFKAELMPVAGGWDVGIGGGVIKHFKSHAKRAAMFEREVNAVLFPSPAPRLAAEE